MPAAARAGRTWPRPSAIPATRAPTAAPTSGKAGAPRATSAASISTSRPAGIRVRKATAPSTALPTGIGHACGLEARHLVQHGQGGLDDRDGECGPGALSQPEPEVEQRLEAERLEDEAVTRLGGTVGSDHRRGRARLEARGDERRGAGDVAVEDDRSSLGRATESDARKQRDLEAPERGECRERLVERAGVDVERTAHDRGLALDALPIEARPGP